MRENKEDVIREIASHYKEIIRLLGEDPDREGLKKTPVRAAKAMFDITSGYDKAASEIISQAIFEHAGSRIVSVKNIEFYSLCEHHILPFFGKISVGYIPYGKMIGLSKIGRLVDVFAKRLQVQERLTSQICHALADHLPNHGVIVKCEASHLCMQMRGVEKQESSTVTIDYTGEFEKNPSLREEFLRTC